jgi:uncharacterized cupredoxin-like copper-binding protein
MRPRRLAPPAAVFVIAVAVLAAGCSAGGDLPAPSIAVASASLAPSTAAPRIEVELSDLLRIEPSAMTVPMGQPVTFVVTNAGTTFHEFVLGDEAEQAAHEVEMMESGGMSMPTDEAMAIGVEPGQTKELTVTFSETGELIAGCHVAGHFAAGMRAGITIQ